MYEIENFVANHYNARLPGTALSLCATMQLANPARLIIVGMSKASCSEISPAVCCYELSAVFESITALPRNSNRYRNLFQNLARGILRRASASYRAKYVFVMALFLASSFIVYLALALQGAHKKSIR